MASIKNLVARDLLRGNLVVKNANVEERVRRLEESSAEYSTVAHALRVDAAVIGQQDKDHVYVGAGGIQLMSNTIVRGEWQSDGDIFIGSDISDPGKRYLSVFAVAQTYNGEAMEAGDMLIGDNSANKANILWDRSAGHMKFRGGATVQSYLDTDGSIVAGIDSVTLDSNGITINAQSQTYVTGGKSIDFYSVTDDFDIAMITATRYNAGGDEYVTLQLQVADDLTHGVNYTGHTNPMLVLSWDQYGRSAGAVDIANAALIVGGPSFTDISPAVAGNVYAGNDLYAVNNVITSLGSAKIGNGAVIGSASANPGYGDLRVQGGIYMGAATMDAPAGTLQGTGDVRVDGGLSVGNKSTDPAAGDVLATGGLSLGGASSNPGTGELWMSGKIKQSTAIGCKVYRTSNLAIANDTVTGVTWNAESWDTDGCFDPSSQYIYCKTPGVYLVVFNCHFTTDWVTNSFNIYAGIELSNDQNVLSWDHFSGSGYWGVTVIAIVNFTAVNQWARATVWHQRGSNMTLTNTSRFGMVKIA